MLLLLAVRALTDPVWQFILFWFPKYMVTAHNQTLEQVGKIGWIPYLAADIGGILGGLRVRAAHPTRLRTGHLAQGADGGVPR